MSTLRSTRPGRWLVVSIIVHAIVFLIAMWRWPQVAQEESEPIPVTWIEPEGPPPDIPPARRLTFSTATHPRVRESLEIPREILALEPPPLEPITEPAAAGGLSIEARSPRALTTIAIGGRGGGRPGTGIGAGNGTAPRGSFGEYVGGLRQAGLDVVFVIDATGSMGWLIDEVKERVQSLARWIRRLVPVTRFGVVVYRDRDDPEFVVRSRPLTLSIRKVRRFLDALEATGGGDIPESVDLGLREAIESAGWKSNSKKVIVILGDAPPHVEHLAETLELARSFRALGGTVTTIDVSFDANPTIAAARLGKPVEELQTISRRGAMPEFLEIAAAGGGDGTTLEGDRRIVRQLALLIFGSEWADDVRPLLGDL